MWQEGGTCKRCDGICPIGTRHEFNLDEFGISFQQKQADNLPEIFNPSESIDHTATIVIVALIFLSIILGALIGIFHNSCKEKSLFIFRELDVRAITGGVSKKFVGGVLISFYLLWVIIVSLGFLVHFFAFNKRTDFTEVTDV